MSRVRGSFIGISILLVYYFMSSCSGAEKGLPQGEQMVSHSDEKKSIGADSEEPGVAGNLILMTSNHGAAHDDENKKLKMILPEDYVDEADVPRAVYTRKDRFYYCGPRGENHCRSLCYAMGYPMHTCGRVSCYCTF